ncbi:hypothetical protein [Peribacillus simplex]|uniref:hypothetical protein n=1 Tax=Peribacillus simplex TaxID=1478 RepID=UPI003D2E59D8
MKYRMIRKGTGSIYKELGGHPILEDLEGNVDKEWITKTVPDHTTALDKNGAVYRFMTMNI